MNTITKLLVPFILCFALQSICAQEIQKDSILKIANFDKIESLKKLKLNIESEERSYLKEDIEIINKRLDTGSITAAKAEELKKEAAKKRALNIENRIAIIDNKIALLQRNEAHYNASNDEGSLVVRIGSGEETNESFIYIGDKSQDKPKVYDKRTTSDFVFAIGFNNTLIDGENLSDSPYKLGGSGFVELGQAWKTRIFKDSNFWRLKYGVSLQWNKLDIKDNKFFVNTDGDVALQEFPSDLNKAKFRTTNLVFPVHIEFGPSKKIERDTYFRYSTRHKFKMGLGGYAGLNIGSMQKLKYKENGDRVKDKQRGDFEVNEFVYGLSGYVAFGDVALYVKYDLNPLFKNQTISQNNISVGFRFDMD
mgnify:CR=1 FL=1